MANERKENTYTREGNPGEMSGLLLRTRKRGEGMHRKKHARYTPIEWGIDPKSIKYTAKTLQAPKTSRSPMKTRIESKSR